MVKMTLLVKSMLPRVNIVMTIAILIMMMKMMKSKTVLITLLTVSVF